jgi:two-component system sensor histidine kinase HydH
MKRFQTRVLWPVVGVAACLLVLGALTATSLIWQQSDLADVFRENLNSRRAAIELDECVSDLLLVLRNRAESPDAPPLGTAIEPLHRRAREHLADIRRFADQPAEKHLADQLDAGFTRYLTEWEGRREEVRRVAAAADRLEAEVLKPCREYKQFNAERIDDNTRRHDGELRTLGWGMAGIGLIGALAGVVLGYGLARAVKRSIRGVQVRVRDAAGKLSPEAADLTVSDDGDFGGLHADLDQLSERVGAVVERLQQREREVRRAEQLAALGQLAAGVAHEVRNPLTSIKMLVQTGEPLTAEDLAVIESEVRRMEASLQTFLDYARPPTAERQPTELVGVVRRAFDLLRPRAERQNVGLVVKADGEVVLTADPHQLHQVVVNLGLNALDAMPSGGTLTATIVSQNRGVSVEVADTGPGIRPDILARLFEPFASGKDTGLGLGLVVCKRIADDHGGTIRGGNGPSGGARFTLSLPSAQVGGGDA